MSNERKPHKHAELIHAWADGAEIQYNMDGEWIDCNGNPDWHIAIEYRIKPEPKPDVLRTTVASLNSTGSLLFGGSKEHNIQFTFDGETGKLKAVELIK